MKLTDDEIVAVAVDAGTYWPGPLPTIDIDDAGELTRAASRGHRSLWVRDLLGEDGHLSDEADPIAPSVRALAGRHDGISVVVADVDLDRRADAFLSVHYPSATEWIVESVSPLGVHEFAVSSAEAQLEYIVQLASALHDATGDDLDRDDRLCIAAGNLPGAAAVVVGPSSVVVGRIDDEGHIAVGDDHVPFEEALSGTLGVELTQRGS